MSDLRSIWEAAEQAVVAADVSLLGRLLREHAALFRDNPPQSTWLGGLAPDYSSADALAIVTREHHFGSYEALAKHLEAVKQADAPAARFETAVDAVVTGDEAALDRSLASYPELIRMRSTRVHRATLLHYVGANGVEGWRQRTPPNAVQIIERLYNAGGEVDAMADMYGGSTTLGLVATSIHPLLAGVQNALMATLLDHGAAMDHPRGAGNGQGIVNGCLANGRPGAAEFLARRGARLDLEASAGVGRLEEVRRFFYEDGSLGAHATRAQAASGLQWACEYGRIPVVEFLLQCGMDPGEVHRGQTALHWAAYGGHADIVKLFLARKAAVNVRDQSWNNTPLGWALYGWAHPPAEGGGDHCEVVAMLVAAGATLEPQWIPGDRVRADSRMAAALRGEGRVG